MVVLAPATSANWRDIARVRATDPQRRWVANVTYYLCLSAYDGLWRSCAVQDERGATVGHVMWAVDPEDDSHWIGGLVIDAERRAPAWAGPPSRPCGPGGSVRSPRSREHRSDRQLSVAPDNQGALGLYRSLGFVETGELSDDEIVLRRVRT